MFIGKFRADFPPIEAIAASNNNPTPSVNVVQRGHHMYTL